MYCVYFCDAYYNCYERRATEAKLYDYDYLARTKVRLLLQ